MQRAAGFLFIILATFFWAFTGPVARYAMEHGVSSMEVAFWRAFWGALSFFLHALLTRSFRVPARVAAIFCGFGVFSIAVFFAVYLLAVEQAGVSLAAVLLYTAPAWVAVLSRVIFHEAISRMKLLALCCAIAGTALACMSGGGLPQGASALGIGLSLFAGFLYSLNYIFGTYYLRYYSPITLYAWCMPMGAVLLFPLVDFVPKTPQLWLAMFALGVLSAYAAYWAYCEGLKRLGGTRASIAATMEPVLAAILAWIIFGERLPFSGWLGTGLVLAGVLLTVVEKKPASS
jgi:drug/metabolite transporter (DMT)-like permease